MNGVAYAKSFRDLITYQKARNLQREVFKLTLTFPKDERFSLTDQVRRSSRSIGANIAEAWAKRRYPNHFLSKLTDAEGEEFETLHWIGTAVDCEYLDSEKAKPFIAKCEEIGRMLGSMMEKADLFCGEEYRTRSVGEAQADYFADSPDVTEY